MWLGLVQLSMGCGTLRSCRHTQVARICRNQQPPRHNSMSGTSVNQILLCLTACASFLVTGYGGLAECDYGCG
jgi:hypothetical protein